MKNYLVFCFHLGLGLYLLHTIQMLLRRRNYEYSCWLSTLFATVISTSFLFNVSSVEWGKRLGTCRGQFIISWSRKSQNLEESEQGEFPFTCPSPHSVAVRWRGYNPNLLMGKEAQKLYFLVVSLKAWVTNLFTGLQLSVLLNWKLSPWPNDSCVRCPGLC